jgi:quercetin dioxygenase-like cupin family protein
MTSVLPYIASNCPMSPQPMNPETIVNPVTGDRMTFLHTAEHSQGSYAQIQFDLPPGAKGSPLHYHTAMDETFTVLAGQLDMEIGQKGQWRSLLPGDTVQVAAGIPHSFCNRSQTWVTFTTENRPATGFERFVRGLYGLAIDGKVNSAGIPTNLLQLSILLKQADTVPVGVPPLLFGLSINSLVGLAQLFNVERSLLKYWPNRRGLR